MRARFSSQAARQSRARVKKAEAAKSEGGAKNLRAQLKAVELREKNKDAEIQRLHARLNIGPITTQKGPSTKQSQGIILFTQNFGC
jgi:hypothetical protein